MRYELEIITNITTNNGKAVKIIKKHAKIRKIFNLEEIELEEFVEPKTGKHVSKYSGIYCDNVYYKINKPYEELKYLVLNRTLPVLGLASKSIKYNEKNKKSN